MSKFSLSRLYTREWVSFIAVASIGFMVYSQNEIFRSEAFTNEGIALSGTVSRSEVVRKRAGDNTVYVTRLTYRYFVGNDQFFGTYECSRDSRGCDSGNYNPEDNIPILVLASDPSVSLYVNDIPDQGFNRWQRNIAALFFLFSVFLAMKTRDKEKRGAGNEAYKE